jgi:hypothetical protein
MGEATQKDEYTDMDSHTPGTAKGEEARSRDGEEPGRVAREDIHGNAVSTEGSTARMSTGINAEKRDPIDPKMPKMPPA